MNAIEIHQLCKSYGNKPNVLQGIDLEIPKGAVFGYLGPNGAGKTTTVRILNGILRPTLGSASILGMDVTRKRIEISRRVGVMTETAESYEHLSGKENLVFFGQLFGMTQKEASHRTDELLKLFELSLDANRKVKEYSTGMRKRIAFARALIHHPEVLFLDEPTTGLDPEAARNVMQLIQQMAREEQATVVMCTHQLKYAEEICTHYGLLSEGKILASGTYDDLLQNLQHFQTLRVRIQPNENSSKFQVNHEGWIEYNVKDDNEAADKIAELIHSGVRVIEAKLHHLSLEEIYFSYRKQEKNQNTEEETHE